MNKFNEQYEKWLNECGESEPDCDAAYAVGWNNCQKAILEILKQPIQNADLSWEECDSRFIEKIEEL